MTSAVMAPIAGLFTLGQLPLDQSSPASAERLPIPGEAWLLRDFIDSKLVDALCEGVADAKSMPVGPDGILMNYKPGTQPASWRSSAFDHDLASHLWVRLPRELLHPRQFTRWGRADHDGHSCWRPVGVNHLHRFIRYESAKGHLVAHYDAPYVSSPVERSLFSLVVYLTDNEDGHTRFLRDGQDALPFEERDFNDWSRTGHLDEVLLAIAPRRGDALLFEHRILHDGARSRFKRKLILRTDLMFERVAPA